MGSSFKFKQIELHYVKEKRGVTITGICSSEGKEGRPAIRRLLVWFPAACHLPSDYVPSSPDLKLRWLDADIYHLMNNNTKLTNAMLSL